MVVTSPSRASNAPPPGYLRAPVPVHFPEAEQVPETKLHLEQKTLLYQILTLAFGDRAAIGCDQFVYWDPTDPRQCLAPDAFLRLDAPNELFRSWKVWERGAPDVAVEVLSAIDERDRDFAGKLDKYRRLGVRELVTFDPERGATLRVWGAVDGDLVERTVDGASASSHCLPAFWVVVPDPRAGSLLRLSRDAAGKDLLATPAEQARLDAELIAEKRIRELEAELARRPPP